MGLTFTRAPRVAPGDPILGEDFRALALAFNDRLRSGIGDPTYRIHQLVFNLFRQARLPDATGSLWPGLGEALEFYAHFDPRRTALEWPVSGPGEPEGANLANPLMQFVFGVPELGLADEEARLTASGFSLELPGGRKPVSLEDFWELAKWQRGAVDPNSGAQSAPAMAAAQSIFAFAFPANSPMGKSYGGYFPDPEVSADYLGLCGDSDSNGGLVTNCFLKFTGLGSGVSTDGLHGTVSTDAQGNPVVTYPGSCPLGTLYTAENHVCFVGRFPFAYYLYLNDGAGGYRLDVLPTNYWIEGPYEGAGVLRKADGEQVPRAAQGFAAEFRGTAAQRSPDSFRIEDVGFDFQRFMTRQYALAPALGMQVGEAVEAVYPRARLGGATVLAAGTVGRWDAGGEAFRAPAGFVVAGFLARGSGLSGVANVELVADGVVIAAVALWPDEGADSVLMRYFEGAGYAPTELVVRIGAETRLRAGGELTVELAVVFGYLPEYWDAYLVCRLAATRGGVSTGVDGAGVDSDQARVYGENYFAQGCLHNPYASGVRSAIISPVQNPIFDHARRRALEWTRLVSRQQFMGYAVAEGKSVLYFRRYLAGYESAGADVFAGIAPAAAAVASGSLVDGVEYVVRASGGGRVVYGGMAKLDGERFTAGTVGVYEASGVAAVYEYEGIRAAARPGGWSNEWLMFAETKCYYPSDSSEWKPSVYGDYFPFNSRCQFYRYASSMSDQALSRFFFPASKTNALAPEAPPGYHYAGGTNATATADFYRSCRVYEPDPEVESATVEFWSGIEVVKLVFKGRFHCCAGALAAVDKDPTAWSAGERADLAAESYRTLDNALREYALSQADPSYQCSQKIGDAAMHPGIGGIGSIFGSCYPHFFFTRLAPIPYLHPDGGHVTGYPATRCTVDAMQQMEAYLRAMCEGFVDGMTTASVGCAAGGGSLYDFTWESLCYQAFGGRNVGAFSLLVRPDLPAGYGPLPNTVMYADVFGRLAAGVNLLDTARVMLPFEIEWRERTSTALKTVPAEEVWPTGATCAAGYVKCKWSGMPPGISTLGTWSAWSTVPTVTSPAIATTILSTCDGSDWQCQTARTDVEMRVSIPSDAQYAIPDAWVDMLGEAKFLLRITIQQDANRATRVETSEESSGCAQVGLEDHSWWDLGMGYGYLMETVNEVNSTYCEIASPGIHNPGNPVRADYGYIHTGAGFPEPECYYWGSRTYGIDVISDLGFAVTVPMVDP